MSEWPGGKGKGATAGAVGLIAALGAGVAVAMPSSAESPTARAASPVVALAAQRDSGPSNAAPGPSFTTVLSRRVRPARYAVNAKVILITSSSTGSDCILTIGRREIDRSNQPLVLGGASARSTHPLQFAGPLRGVLRLRCRAGTTWSGSNAKITAIQLTALSKQVF